LGLENCLLVFCLSFFAENENFWVLRMKFARLACLFWCVNHEKIVINIIIGFMLNFCFLLDGWDVYFDKIRALGCWNLKIIELKGKLENFSSFSNFLSFPKKNLKFFLRGIATARKKNFEKWFQTPPDPLLVRPWKHHHTIFLPHLSSFNIFTRKFLI